MGTTVQLEPPTDLADLLERVLDKGVMLEAWLRVSPAGIDLRKSGGVLKVERRSKDSGHR